MRPTELYIQVDGAADNKCRAVFMYAEYLIRADIFDVVIISFLIVGHTHNSADRKFVPITFELRKGCVKKMQDLIDIYWKAYGKDKPECVEVVKSVADYTTWLVQRQGKVFKGFSRRVPDHHRPHQFIFSRSGDTIGGVKMDYKNLSVDGDIWNKDQKAFNLLRGLPDVAGPNLQLPSMATQKAHLAKLAASRADVFKHFNLNTDAEEWGAVSNTFFSVEDMAYTKDLFDLFSTPTGVAV